ncbi:MAG: methylmalonyl Co-A mutase-associated GTPase MeaB [Cyclobacteriaceae bacterium]
MVKKRFPVKTYIEGIVSGDRVLLSQAITLVESTLKTDLNLAHQVVQGILPYTGNSLRLGISGIPGAGKSTLIGNLGKVILKAGKKLAVLTVDPSSKISGGSILGDKTRMEAIVGDARVYIRPSPTGNTLGGVSAKTREILLLCEAAGFDVVIIETVGVGQSEVAVKEMVDAFLLLLITGAGDELQGIKKGIMEMADFFLINKADGKNAEKAVQTKSDLEKVLHYFPAPENGWQPTVLTCSSLSHEGLQEIWESILEYEQTVKNNGFFERNRSLQQISWLETHIRFLLEREFYSHPEMASALEKGKSEVLEGKDSAIGMARRLVDLFFSRIGF